MRKLPLKLKLVFGNNKTDSCGNIRTIFRRLFVMALTGKKLLQKQVMMILLTVLMGSTLLCSCKKNVPEEKTYVWEKPGFPDDFYITLKPNGKYELSIGSASSYTGRGDWTVNEDNLTLTDEISGDICYFHYLEDQLLFIEEGSAKFGILDVKDGDSFPWIEGYDPWSDPPIHTLIPYETQLDTDKGD